MAEAPTPLPAEQVETDPRPLVALPRPALPGAVIAAIGVVLAILLFVALEARRRQSSAPANPAEAATVPTSFQPPPELVVPPEVRVDAAEAPAASFAVPPVIVRGPRPAPPVQMVAPPPIYVPTGPADPPRSYSEPAPRAPPSAKQAEIPALVYDEGPVAAGSSKPPLAGTDPAKAKGDGATDEGPTPTTVIGNRGKVMATGTMIPAVLETPIDSSRPGLIRAVVSEDARGFDARYVLIPRGSRLIGEYQSDVKSGQHRVLVNWTRVIRPDGIAVKIGSPAADASGGAGVPGHVNNFFFQRFAAAALQSALAVGVNLASRPGNGSVIVGFPGNAAGSIGQNLIPTNDLQPKITVKQGALVNVFVAHDLDFSGAPLPRQEKGR